MIELTFNNSVITFSFISSAFKTVPLIQNINIYQQLSVGRRAVSKLVVHTGGFSVCVGLGFFLCHEMFGFLEEDVDLKCLNMLN